MGSLEDGFQSLRVMGIRANNMEMQKAVSMLEQQIQMLTMSLHDEQEKVRKLKKQVEELESELIRSGARKAPATNAEKQFIADWIVSQKAFKELAIEYGSQLGLKPDVIKKAGVAKELDVLDCKNDPSHGTNADSDFLRVHAPALKKKIQSEKK